MRQANREDDRYKKEKDAQMAHSDRCGFAPAAPFLDDLQALEATWISNDPSTGFGELIVCITYQNGDIDLIGTYNNAVIVGEKVDYQNWYFDRKEFKELFARYAGDTMPDDVFSWPDEQKGRDRVCDPFVL